MENLEVKIKKEKLIEKMKNLKHKRKTIIQENKIKKKKDLEHMKSINNVVDKEIEEIYYNIELFKNEFEKVKNLSNLQKKDLKEKKNNLLFYLEKNNFKDSRTFKLLNKKF